MSSSSHRSSERVNIIREIVCFVNTCLLHWLLLLYRVRVMSFEVVMVSFTGVLSFAGVVRITNRRRIVFVLRFIVFVVSFVKLYIVT